MIITDTKSHLLSLREKLGGSFSDFPDNDRSEKVDFCWTWQ